MGANFVTVRHGSTFFDKKRIAGESYEQRVNLAVL